MIEADFNGVGMIIFYCTHVKGYEKGKGKNICNRCQKRVINKIAKSINSK